MHSPATPTPALSRRSMSRTQTARASSGSPTWKPVRGSFCGIVGGDIAQVTWQPIPIVDATAPASDERGCLRTRGDERLVHERRNAHLDGHGSRESGVCNTQGRADPATISSETSKGSFTCFAINKARGTVNRATRRIKVDLTDPSVSCVLPSPVFFKGQAGARVKATVSDALSVPTTTSASSSGQHLGCRLVQRQRHRLQRSGPRQDRRARLRRQARRSFGRRRPRCWRAFRRLLP